MQLYAGLFSELDIILKIENTRKREYQYHEEKASHTGYTFSVIVDIGLDAASQCNYYSY